jgi:SAM-dependent methyltransferase
MKYRLNRYTVLVLSFTLLATAAYAVAQDESESSVKKDVPYVPTPQEVVDKMLDMAKVTKTDTVYDLGCGDGRMVVTAAKKFGAKGIGVDIDPERIKESNENAKKEGVTDKVTFHTKDLFTMDFKDCDVLTMYLLPSVNMKLRPKILDLKPGTRIVSHAFDMEDWDPDEKAEVEGRQIYFWIVPAKVDGTWKARMKGADGKEQDTTLTLKQQFQNVTGTAKVGDKDVEIKEGKLKGSELSFNLDGAKYTAKVEGDTIKGTAGGDAKSEFTAKKS